MENVKIKIQKIHLPKSMYMQKIQDIKLEHAWKRKKKSIPNPKRKKTPCNE